MGSNYIFSLTPTFTQGLVLGQFSILCLVVLILKYLFLDSTQYPFETSSYHPRVNSTLSPKDSEFDAEEPLVDGAETAEWFHALLQQLVAVYRSKLRGDKAGSEGDEIARQCVEDYANSIRPTGFLDHITIHSLETGVSAPRLFNARILSKGDSESEVVFDMNYMDTVSISLSTSYLFNYPMPSFARLPFSLTISLSLFKSQISVTPPSPLSPAPALTISISPDFTLELSTSSLMGSRAKLANVPKLHELIQHQVRNVLANKGTWKVVLPGLSSVAQVKEEVEKAH
jgi:maintenance of morphology protein 1